MYKGTHENAQRRVDHIRAAEILQPVQITLQEEYLTVKRILAPMNKQIELMPKGPERSALVERQVSLTKRAGELKKKLGIVRHANLSECIATQAKLICSPAIWECILNAAKAEWAEIEKIQKQPGTPVEN